MSAVGAREILERLRRAGVVPRGMTTDSRRVQPGDLFIAWPGSSADGRRYAASAVARGAAAVLWDDSDGVQAEALPVPVLPVSGLRNVAGFVAHEIYGRPSAALWIAGVTGTNGKTTVTQWLARALTDLDVRCGVIGTLGSGFPDQLVDSGLTTPDAADMHRMLAGFAADGGAAAAIEISSIGLDQHRADGIEFDLAVFTNLTRDHLDYHGSMNAYAAAKNRLFDLPGIRAAVINLDDNFGLAQARRLAAGGMPVIGFTRDQANAAAVPGARVLVASAEQDASPGLRFALEWEGVLSDLQVRMVAPFNVSNVMAVVGALLVRDVALPDIVRVVSRLSPPEGRMQLIGGVGEPLVVVDYAHSPDALAKVLDAVRSTAHARGGRLICVFGCGGDRDAGKRPLMGEVARARADRVVVTSDNPRGEDPAVIIAAIVRGAGPEAERVIDRAAAIRSAIAEASADDVIVLAGKGHEPYQEVMGRRMPFSDVEQARTALNEWNRARGAHS